MAITNLDIKFRQSERMTDFADGGGRMGATEIIDNAMNNVFSDRSELDGILGRVSLRKLFLHVDTNNTDTYLGSFVFLTDPPDDPRVFVTLFNTKSATDERNAARSYVEAYRVKGPKTQFILYGTQLAGQKTIQLYCRTETASPDIGDVLCLSVEADGYTPGEQYVRVEEVASRFTTTFTDSSGDFQRDVLIVKITTPLLQNFVGQEDPQRYTGNNPPPTKVRSTQVADVALYYTVKPLAETAEDGDLTVLVDSPYIAIVPSTQAETPLVDQRAGLGTVSMVVAGAVDALTYSENLGAAAGVAVTRYLGSPFARRSLKVLIAGGELRDDGSGNLVATLPDNLGWSGTVDYETGAISIQRDIAWAGNTTITATPAGAVLEQGYSASTLITPANRQNAYVFQIPGAPAPGTVTLDFLALGKWIRLRDTGSGQLAGAPGEGSGTINYATGTVAVTLGALPDVDSAILLSWGIDLRARKSAGEITIPTPQYTQQLAHGNVDAATLTMDWTVSAVPKSATCNASGVISGDATGTLDAVAGLVQFTLSGVPDASITYDYEYLDPTKVHSEVFAPTPAGGAVTFSLAHPPIKTRSVEAAWVQTLAGGSLPTSTVHRRRVAVDNGAGSFTGAPAGTNTINYVTGEIVLTVEG